MKTKIEIIETVAAKVAGLVRRNYSGRGMYGKTCVGIVCESPVTAVKSAQSRGLSGALTDNMGRDYIVYWPAVTAESRVDDDLDVSENDRIGRLVPAQFEDNGDGF